MASNPFKFISNKVSNIRSERRQNINSEQQENQSKELSKSESKGGRFRPFRDFFRKKFSANGNGKTSSINASSNAQTQSPTQREDNSSENNDEASRAIAKVNNLKEKLDSSKMINTFHFDNEISEDEGLSKTPESLMERINRSERNNLRPNQTNWNYSNDSFGSLGTIDCSENDENINVDEVKPQSQQLNNSMLKSKITAASHRNNRRQMNRNINRSTNLNVSSLTSSQSSASNDQASLTKANSNSQSQLNASFNFMDPIVEHDSHIENNNSTETRGVVVRSRESLISSSNSRMASPSRDESFNYDNVHQSMMIAELRASMDKLDDCARDLKQERISKSSQNINVESENLSPSKIVAINSQLEQTPVKYRSSTRVNSNANINSKRCTSSDYVNVDESSENSKPAWAQIAAKKQNTWISQLQEGNSAISGSSNLHKSNESHISTENDNGESNSRAGRVKSMIKDLEK